MCRQLNIQAILRDRVTVDPNERLYLLLDHAGLPGLLRILDKYQLHWVSLFEDMRESSAIEAAPILVDALDANKVSANFFFDWIEKNGIYSSSVILLSTPLPMDALLQRLSKRLEISLSEQMKAMLRFFDPRVLEQLRITLTPEQFAEFFSVGTNWWYINRTGMVENFESTHSLHDGPLIPLSLSAQQEFELVAASEGDQLLSFLLKHLPTVIEKTPADQRYFLILKCIQHAKTLGLESIHDFAIYTTAHSKYGENFMRRIFSSRLADDGYENQQKFREVIVSFE